jgi:hypothetical protein
MLTAIGASPLPADMCPLPSSSLDGSGRHQYSNRISSWWTVVNPATEAETDLQMTMVDTPMCLRSLASSRSLTSSVSQWTCFDFKKFKVALKIIERCSSFFRIRCNEWVKLAASMAATGNYDHDHDDDDVSTFYDKLGLGLLKFDFDVLTFTFQSLGNLYLQLSQDHDDHNAQWMKSPFVYSKIDGDVDDSNTVQKEEDRIIRRDLLHAIESILCAVFDLSKATIASTKYQNHISGSTDLDFQMHAELEQCVKISNRFPPHSFVHQIGRNLLSNC